MQDRPTPTQRGRRPIGAAHHRRGRRARSQDGLVLVSVLIVVVMGTAIAMVTARDSRYAVRSAGHDRADIQGRYAAEGALMATLTWFDLLAQSPMRFYNVVLLPWKQSQGATPPRMLPRYPEPSIPLWFTSHPTPDSLVHDPARVVSPQIEASQAPALEIPPHTVFNENLGLGVDQTGMFGNTQYIPAPNFEVDIYDCVPGPPEDLGQPDSPSLAPLRCMITARHRSVLLAGSQSEDWLVASEHPTPEDTYRQLQFARLHSISAAIETVPVP